MKKIMIIALFFIVSCFPLYAEKAAIEYDYEKVEAGTGSSYEWVGNGFFACKKSDVKDCKITVTYDDGTSEVLEVVGGWTWKIKISEITFTNANTSAKITDDAKHFLFLNESYLRITESNEFPILNGLRLSISGYQVDNNNYLTVFIPNGGY